MIFFFSCLLGSRLIDTAATLSETISRSWKYSVAIQRVILQDFFAVVYSSSVAIDSGVISQCSTKVKSLLSGSEHFSKSSLISSASLTTRMRSNFFNCFSACNDGPSKRGRANNRCCSIDKFGKGMTEADMQAEIEKLKIPSFVATFCKASIEHK